MKKGGHRSKALIIGGGIAGATVAERLSRSGLEVHLVEKSPDIGGHTAEMGCKAADVCMRCNVCVADDIFRGVRDAAAAPRAANSGAAPIRLHTSTELLELHPGRNGARYKAVLTGKKSAKQTINADHVVIAIGYDPFDPAENSSFNYGKLANVITGIEAEQQLAGQHKLFRPSDKAIPKRVAFIQCVGSRTEETHRRPEDTNYCSTVCCSYALRMAQLIKHQGADEAEVTVFYMDIQKFGKDFERFYKDCKNKIRFIRSRPYEMRLGSGRTVLVKYASELPAGKGKAMPPPGEQAPAVSEEEFDLVVLSVGIRPPEEGLKLADKLGVATDEQGFFGLKRASDLPDLQKEGIYAVGACESPKDIAGCIAQAEAISAEILGSSRHACPRPRGRGVCRNTAVIGGGIAGMRAALSLARLGYEATLIHAGNELGGKAVSVPELLGHLDPDTEDSGRKASCFMDRLIRAVKADKAIRLLPRTEVESVRGEQGDFQVILKRGNKSETLNVGAIVLATGADDAVPARNGSRPIIDLAELPDKIRTGDCGKTAAVILDGAGEHGRDEWIQTLTASEIMARRFGTQVKIYCGNARVAVVGLESLYRRARESGVIVVKYQKKPVVREQDGRILILSSDSVTGAELSEEFETAVVVGRTGWNEGLSGRIAGLKTGPEGEAQQDNIWLLPGLTNRPGIFAVGAARGDTEYRAALTDGAAAAQAVHALFIGDELQARDDTAEVDADKCVLCLTCLRVCPHGAINIDDGKKAAAPSPVSCRRCGTCVSECPARAITLPGFSDEQMEKKIGAKPKVTVFACENSAAPAVRDAGIKLKKAVNIIEVPCAGNVDPGMVLSALESGASKVMIIGCHPESCRYLSGSTRADKRMRRIADMLKKAGFDGSRVSFRGISSVEPGKIAEYIR